MKLITLSDMRIFADKLQYQILGLPENINVNVYLNESEYHSLQKEIRDEAVNMPYSASMDPNLPVAPGSFITYNAPGMKFIIQMEVENVHDN